jgi:hypothetical protein
MVSVVEEDLSYNTYYIYNMLIHMYFFVMLICKLEI